jgi:hypothetical protein
MHVKAALFLQMAAKIKDLIGKSRDVHADIAPQHPGLIFSIQRADRKHDWSSRLEKHDLPSNAVHGSI